MKSNVLIIATMDGLENCARVLAEQLDCHVEVAENRRSGLAMLRRGEFDVVVLEQRLADRDPAWTDVVWASAGLAMPLQVNFAIAGAGRLLREVKAALGRREREQAVAKLAAVVEVENNLKSCVTGLLLESELALREPSLSPALRPKLARMVELAAVLSDRLRGPVTASNH